MFRTFTILLLCFVPIIDAKADIVIQLQSTTMTAGTSGFVDVWLTGAPVDQLGRFGYEFSISGATPQSGDLQFAVVQSNSEQTIGSSLPDHQGYVFLGDTDAGNWNSNLGANAVTLVGGDVLNIGNFVSIEGRYLLARLELLHTGAMSLASHAFTISLNQLSPVTEFDMDWDADTTTNYSAGQITSLSGTITIAAVPEPSTFALLGLFAAGGAIRSRWRIKKQRDAAMLVT